MAFLENKINDDIRLVIGKERRGVERKEDEKRGEERKGWDRRGVGKKRRGGERRGMERRGGKRTEVGKRRHNIIGIVVEVLKSVSHPLTY